MCPLSNYLSSSSSSPSKSPPSPSPPSPSSFQIPSITPQIPNLITEVSDLISQRLVSVEYLASSYLNALSRFLNATRGVLLASDPLQKWTPLAKIGTDFKDQEWEAVQGIVYEPTQTRIISWWPSNELTIQSQQCHLNSYKRTSSSLNSSITQPPSSSSVSSSSISSTSVPSSSVSSSSVSSVSSVPSINSPLPMTPPLSRSTSNANLSSASGTPCTTTTQKSVENMNAFSATYLISPNSKYIKMVSPESTTSPSTSTSSTSKPIHESLSSSSSSSSSLHSTISPLPSSSGILSLPISDSGRLYGIYIEPSRDLTTYDLEILVICGRMMAVAMSLRAGLEIENKKAKLTEEKKTISENREEFDVIDRDLLEDIYEAVQTVNVFLLIRDENNRVLFINNYAKKVLGETETTPKELTVGGIVSRIHPDDLPYYIQNVKDSWGKSDVRFEFRFLLGNGEYRWLRDDSIKKSYGTKTRWFSVTVDINELKLAEAKALAREHDIATYMELQPAIAWCMDDEGKLLFLSEQWETYTGIPVADALKNPDLMWSAIHPDDLVKAKESHESNLLKQSSEYDRGKKNQFEHRLRGKDGIYRYHLDICVTSPPLPNCKPRTMGLNIDVDVLHKARREALEAIEVKGRFLTNMSHELRTPLNGVLGVLDLLSGEEYQVNDEQAALIKIARESTEWVMSVINNVLELSKLDRGAVSLEVIPVHLPTLIQHVIDMLGNMAIKKKIDIGGWVEYEDNGPLSSSVSSSSCSDQYRNLNSLDQSNFIQQTKEKEWNGVVWTDGYRVQQVLMNLVSNAIKFTSVGYVAIWCIVKNQREIEFKVQDSGIGMNENYLDHIYEPFGQADASTTRIYGGTGLGLTISKEIVDLMGGQLQCKSKIGYGTTFSFSLTTHSPPNSKISTSSPLSTVTNCTTTNSCTTTSKLISTSTSTSMTTSQILDLPESIKKAIQEHSNSNLKSIDFNTLVVFSKPSGYAILKGILGISNKMSIQNRTSSSHSILVSTLNDLLHAIQTRRIHNIIINLPYLSNQEEDDAQDENQNFVNELLEQLEGFTTYSGIMIILTSPQHNLVIPIPRPNHSYTIKILQKPIHPLHLNRVLQGYSPFSLSPSSQSSPSPQLPFFIQNVLNSGQYYILCAEDNMVSRTLLLKQLIKIGGGQAFAVQNGQELYEMYQSNWKKICFILTDLHMPVMDGMEAVQRIRQYEIEHDIPSIPIVGLTADIQIEVHHQCVLAGMTTCFAKPVRQNDLVDLITKHWIHRLRE